MSESDPARAPSATPRDAKPEPEPLWREEVSIFAADERYVGRRQFAKFLVLTSLGMLAGNLWILGRSLLRRPATRWPVRPVARVAEIPVGGARLFDYPTANDPCLLVRYREDAFVAYAQRCTHLSCPVYWRADEGRVVCPCHHGAFAIEDGRVLQGPPPRPLPRIALERRDDVLYAVGVEEAT